jgi:hypothetical protein
MMNDKSNQQMEELQTIVTNAHAHLNQRKETSAHQVPRVESRQVPRVDTNETKQTPPSPSVNHTPNRMCETPKTRRRSHRNSLSHLTAKINLPDETPAMSTRSKVRVANEYQRVTRLRQPTKSSLRKTRQANAVVSKSNWQRIINRMEQDIERAMAVMDHDSGKMMNYRQLRKHPKYNKAWTTSSANEFGRLASGVGGRVKGKKTIRFLHQDDVPQQRRKDITYGSFQCNVQPEKIEEPNRTRFVAGGDRINYPGDVATPTAEMLVAKILFNSVIST